MLNKMYVCVCMGEGCMKLFQFNQNITALKTMNNNAKASMLL